MDFTNGGMDMEEKILQGKKNGMLVLVITTLLYIAAGVGLVFGILADSMVLLVVTIVWLAIGWIPWLGLKVLKPQEALVLTLFGKYYGTLKDDGFYFVKFSLPCAYLRLKDPFLFCIFMISF